MRASRDRVRWSSAPKPQSGSYASTKELADGLETIPDRTRRFEVKAAVPLNISFIEVTEATFHSERSSLKVAA
jgi:hypothetical protein